MNIKLLHHAAGKLNLSSILGRVEDLSNFIRCTRKMYCGSSNNGKFGDCFEVLIEFLNHPSHPGSHWMGFKPTLRGAKGVDFEAVDKKGNRHFIQCKASSNPMHQWNANDDARNLYNFIDVCEKSGLCHEQRHLYTNVRSPLDGKLSGLITSHPGTLLKERILGIDDFWGKFRETVKESELEAKNSGFVWIEPKAKNQKISETKEKYSEEPIINMMGLKEFNPIINKAIEEGKSFLDPVCGTGSFLVHIFDCLMGDEKSADKARLALGRVRGSDSDLYQVVCAREKLHRRVQEYGISREEVDRRIRQGNLYEEYSGKSMKKYIVIGNPPYQKMDQLENPDSRNNSSGSVLYPQIHEFFRKQGAQQICFIVPAKSLQGGKGLNSFRKEVLLSKNTIGIILNDQATWSWFDGNGPPEGHLIYHWDKSHDNNGLVTVENLITKTTNSVDIGQFGGFVLRDQRAETVVTKVLAYGRTFGFQKVYESKPFGIRTNHFKDKNRKRVTESETFAKCFAHGDEGKPFNVKKEEVTKNSDLIECWKVITSKVSPEGSKSRFRNNSGTSNFFIAEPGEICSETYLLLGTFQTRDEAVNFKRYVHTSLIQYIVSTKKCTQDVIRGFDWVPKADYSIPWDDQKVYELFNITDEEIKLIESEMERAMGRHRRWRKY